MAKRPPDFEGRIPLKVGLDGPRIGEVTIHRDDEGLTVAGSFVPNEFAHQVRRWLHDGEAHALSIDRVGDILPLPRPSLRQRLRIAWDNARETIALWIYPEAKDWLDDC